jgi:hypothetical protein
VQRQETILFSDEVSRPAWAVNQAFYALVPPVLCIGTAGFSLTVKRRVHEADRSPPSSSEVQKECSYNSTPPYAFMAFKWTIIFIFSCEKQALREDDIPYLREGRKCTLTVS